MSDRPPSRAQIARRIHELSGLSPATADRRAGTLLSWRRQVGMEPPKRAAPEQKRSTRGSSPSRQLPLPISMLSTPQISEPLVRDILRDNPWWQHQPGKALPSTRRAFVASIHRRLQTRLAPVVVVRGPRQVGKTTVQLQVIGDLLDRGVEPRRILRVQFDELPDHPA